MSAKQSLTEQVNDSNVSSIQNQIRMKTQSAPYFGTFNEAESIVTDMDHFPYTRFFRGVYNSSQPIVFEREAGWRPQHDNCYKVGSLSNQVDNKCNQNTTENYPNHCFETACSTVYPCYPSYLQKIADRDALNVQLNNSCIVQYR